MLYIIVAIILLLLIIPILTIILCSFTNSNYFNWPITEYSLKWYGDFFSDSKWYLGLSRSLLIAVLTTFLAITFGCLSALALSKLRFRGKDSFVAIMISPMMIPVIIVSISLYYSFAPLGLTNSILGIVLGHTIVAMPMAFITIMSGFSQIDKSIEDASLSLGASPIASFFKITLPTIKPAIFSSAAFAFVASLDELTITLYMSGAKTKTLPIVMWETMRYNVSPLIAVASTLLIGGVVLIFCSKGIFSITQNRKKTQDVKGESK